MNNSPTEKSLPWLKIIEKMGKQKSYKPILLLSLIKEFEKGKFSNNKIMLTDEIENRFDSFYDTIGNQQGVSKSYQPFYYLHTDQIWDIKWRSSANKNIPSSNSGMRNNIQFASMKPHLFELLFEKDVREIIKDRLMMKAEEDVRIKDPKKNPNFIPPSDISKFIIKIFGESHFKGQITQEERESRSLEFTEEKLLQKFLVNQWENISIFSKRKLQIYGGVGVGVEYDTKSAGRIDILAEQKLTHDFTVIELKKSTSGERHLGQLLRYMGWVRSKLVREDNNVFGLLVAAKFPEAIRFPMSELRNVELFVYSLNFELNPIKN